MKAVLITLYKINFFWYFEKSTVQSNGTGSPFDAIECDIIDNAKYIRSYKCGGICQKTSQPVEVKSLCVEKTIF